MRVSTTRATSTQRTILVDGNGVGRVHQFCNGRYGITDLNGEAVSDESFRTIKELCENYERVTTWLSFGDVARGRLDQQCQYASRMIDGRHGSPCLGEGLRFQDRTGGPVDVSDYHDIRIHRDDVERFVERVKAWRAETGRE
jgi:hypothetical protein